MLKSLLHKIIKPKNERTLSEYYPLVDRINELEREYEGYSDDQLKGMTNVFRKRIIENAVERAKDRLNNDQKGLRNTLQEIFGEEEGNEFLAVGVNKHHNKVLTQILSTLEQEIVSKIKDVGELVQFEGVEENLLKEGIEEFLRETLHEEMENSMDETAGEL